MKKGIVVGAIVTVFAAAVAVIARIAMMRNVEAEQEIEEEASDDTEEKPEA
ncbi:MAG: hypothetical protein J6Z31_05290 [Fibrobacter sp.]|nr:hypothetical protein [Fibrobacter sp.]